MIDLDVIYTSDSCFELFEILKCRFRILKILSYCSSASKCTFSRHSPLYKRTLSICHSLRATTSSEGLTASANLTLIALSGAHSCICSAGTRERHRVSDSIRGLCVRVRGCGRGTHDRRVRVLGRRDAATIRQRLLPNHQAGGTSWAPTRRCTMTRGRATRWSSKRPTRTPSLPQRWRGRMRATARYAATGLVNWLVQERFLFRLYVCHVRKKITCWNTILAWLLLKCYKIYILSYIVLYLK